VSRLKRGVKNNPAQINEAIIALEKAKINEHTIRLNINMHDRGTMFLPPPSGQLGVYQVQEEPQCKANDKVEFRFQHDLIMTGLVLGVEYPGSSIRPDMEKFKSWYKIHWIPIHHTPIEIERLRSIETCPRCRRMPLRNKVIKTTMVDGKRIRVRKCSLCRLEWSTVETFVGIVENKYAKSTNPS
jgi:hypothetical protein